jgi:hypothetical protein
MFTPSAGCSDFGMVFVPVINRGSAQFFYSVCNVTATVFKAGFYSGVAEIGFTFLTPIRTQTVFPEVITGRTVWCAHNFTYIDV